MKEGRITKKSIDWSGLKSIDLEVEKSRYFQNDIEYSDNHYNSCASAALSLLTNISVRTIEKFCPDKAWSTSMISKFLKSKGYVVIEVSKGGILSHTYNGGEPLSKHHCLLINANSDAEENSLYIMHRNKVYHHFHLQVENDPLFFFNKPTQDVLLVFHKKWNKNHERVLSHWFYS